MENEKKPTSPAAKRPWHSPELRKNTIQENTKAGLQIGIDGQQAGTSAPPI